MDCSAVASSPQANTATAAVEAAAEEVAVDMEDTEATKADTK